jgi:hypothetical protein
MARVFPLLHKHVILSDTALWQWTGRRPGCHPGGAGVGVTEFSGVRAYNPILVSLSSVNEDFAVIEIYIRRLDSD